MCSIEEFFTTHCRREKKKKRFKNLIYRRFICNNKYTCRRVASAMIEIRFNIQYHRRTCAKCQHKFAILYINETKIYKQNDVLTLCYVQGDF